jgi:hypothetical protein
MLVIYKANGNDFILATNSGNSGNLILRTNAFNRMTINGGGKISVNSSAITAQFNIKGDDEALNLNGAKSVDAIYQWREKYWLPALTGK